ncbi:MAG: hypothetical protein ACOX5A_02455 [Aminivibrio sp.]|jgi:hypothetical protein
MNSSSDILSASSTLITVIAVLYSLWYSDIERISCIELPKFDADREPLRRTMRIILYSKVLPLLLINTSYFLIFLPESLCSTLHFYNDITSGSSWYFDSIIVSIVFMNVISFIFVIILIIKAIAINKKIREKGA